MGPLGLALKAGVWYLVANSTSDASGPDPLFRVANILDPKVLDEAVTRPPAFDLATYWQQSVMRFEARPAAGDRDLAGQQEGADVWRSSVPRRQSRSDSRCTLTRRAGRR